MKETMSRRSFLGLAGVAAAATGMGLAGCSQPLPDTATPEWMPESWGYEADFVVVGHGGAGLAAAITSVDEDLGSCIILEAAPEEFRGGNSRVCGQNLMIPKDVDEAIVYQKAMNDIYTLDDDPEVEDRLYRAWAEGLHENLEWLTNLGANMTETTMNSSEFKKLPGAELGGQCYLYDDKVGYSALWDFLDEEKEARSVETHYDARAVELVRNPETNEALGVITETDSGDRTYYKAKKGVILACGGFEWDFRRLNDTFTLGSPYDGNFGSPYNRGDGFAMVAPFGAQLWHMNNVMGVLLFGEGCGKDNPITCCVQRYGTKSYIFVGPNGRRFMTEDYLDISKHSKMLNGSGVYTSVSAPQPAWAVFDQKCFDAETIMCEHSMGWQNIIGLVGETNQDFLDAGVIVKADTIEELAAQIDLPADNLAETVAKYNGFCEAQFDSDFHRGEPKEVASSLDNMWGVGLDKEEEASASPGYDLEPLEGPFYAMRLHNTCINTQGGPKRDENCNVTDVFGNPVPRLYSTGEFGTIYAYQYNGGANFSDALASGRCAVRSAAQLTAWDESAE